jgi:hypothetical protein
MVCMLEFDQRASPRLLAAVHHGAAGAARP